MNKLELEIAKLIEQRKNALARMHAEFEVADRNNASMQPIISQMISDLTTSIEELERFEQLVMNKDLK